MSVISRHYPSFPVNIAHPLRWANTAATRTTILSSTAVIDRGAGLGAVNNVEQGWRRLMADDFTTPWMTPVEAATYLGISLGTLRNWTSARYVPFARRGRVVRYRREILDDWLARDGCDGRHTIADLSSTRRHQSSGTTS